MAKKVLLSDKQLAVLNWVADGRPKGVYDEGFEHRITARALERRGLLQVRGHGPAWRATVTTDGRYYLDHGTYPPSDEPEPPKVVRTRARVVPPAPVPIDDLFDQIEAASGVLRIEAPSEIERVSYRHAVEHARARGEVPAHQRLKVTGTKHGPLVIELLTIAEPDAPGEQIPVPAEADPRRPEVRALARDASLMLVGDDTRPRGLALVQGISDECARRGWSLTVDEQPSFLITIDEDEYRCVLSEEREKRDIFTDEDLAARKYDWQRVSPTRQEVWAGRLRLEIGPRYNSRWWADRKRWTLASKLPDIFATLTELSAAAQDKRDRLAAHHRELVQGWEAAVPRARQRYLHVLNAQRARTQATAWAESEQLRAYADAVQERARSLDGDTALAAREWAEWVRTEAGKGDPLYRDDLELAVSAPEEIGAAELDKYMPNRWTVRRPPDPPTWLPS